MNINVTTNKVTIIDGESLNKGEYKVHKCHFTFSEEYTDDIVKIANFTDTEENVYKMTIHNNECDIPPEILTKPQTILIGVYGFETNNGELVVRYSPTPDVYKVQNGSYNPNEVESEEITPTQYEQYLELLNEGLNEVDSALDEVENINITGEKVDHTFTINITDRNGNTQTTEIHDGVNGRDGRDGVDGAPGRDGTDGRDGRNGTDGVGIQNVEEIQTSSENGGINIVRITLTNGVQSDIQIKNGFIPQDLIDNMIVI